MKNRRDPAPFSHLFGKMVRHPHTFPQCPMRGCDNCQCLLCGKTLAWGQRKACGICARDNDFESYTTQEIDDWFRGLLMMHKMGLKKEN